VRVADDALAASATVAVLRWVRDRAAADVAAGRVGGSPSDGAGGVLRQPLAVMSSAELVALATTGGNHAA
jgi:hypothetical protein